MPSSWIDPTLAAMRQRLFGSRLYDLSLRAPGSLDVFPLPAAFPGDGKRAADRQLSEISAFIDSMDSGQAGDAAHRFDWLSDLVASGTGTAADLARRITTTWLDRNRRWSPLAWQPDILSTRITNWLIHHDFLVSGGPAEFRGRLHESLARQLLQQMRALRLGDGADHGLTVASGLVHAGVAVGGFKAAFSQGLRLLDKAIDGEILADGGHVSRNPAEQARVLASLIQIREALISRHVLPPDALNNAIDRMVPMLRNFRHGDGGLAVFNGASEGEAEKVDAILRKSGVKGRAVSNARHSGFQRLKCGQTLLIVDSGVAAPHSPRAGGNAGTLAFEMSVGKNRVISNCGRPASTGGGLSQALRGTAAHSTLIIDHTNSSELLDGGGFGPRQAHSSGSLRREIDGNVLVELAHDGYADTYGVIHKRSLYLSAKGDDVRGEDCAAGHGAPPATVRFHVNPAVKVSLLGDENSVLLRFGRRSCWRFQAAGGAVAIEESVYFGGGDRRKTSQIVVAMDTGDPKATVKWRFRKES